MKLWEKQQAIKLRRLGWSLNQIYPKIGVSKSTVSLWVRDIVLSGSQKKELSKRGRSKESIEKRRLSRLENESAKREIIIDAARREVPKVSKRELWLIGCALYWAEGGKTQRNLVRFSNSDPAMIKIEMDFFRKICRVPEEKFRAHIHIHPHLNHKKAERYWSSIAGIPLHRFYKTYRGMSKASKQKKDSLPFGTCDIYIGSTALFLRIQGWIQGISRFY